MIRHCTFILVTALLPVGCARKLPPIPERLVAEKIQKFGGTITLNEDDPARSINGVVLPPIKTTDVQMKLLSGLDQLQTLDVENSEVSDDGLSHLAELIELRSLDLHGTKITDEGLVHLSKLSNLHTLDLSDTQISDNGVEHLKTLSQLESLILFETNVTDDGISILRKSLPGLDVIDASGKLAKEL